LKKILYFTKQVGNYLKIVWHWCKVNFDFVSVLLLVLATIGMFIIVDMYDESMALRQSLPTSTSPTKFEFGLPYSRLPELDTEEVERQIYKTAYNQELIGDLVLMKGRFLGSSLVDSHRFFYYYTFPGIDEYYQSLKDEGELEWVYEVSDYIVWYWRALNYNNVDIYVMVESYIDNELVMFMTLNGKRDFSCYDYQIVELSEEEDTYGQNRTK